MEHVIRSRRIVLLFAVFSLLGGLLLAFRIYDPHRNLVAVTDKGLIIRNQIQNSRDSKEILEATHTEFSPPLSSDQGIDLEYVLNQTHKQQSAEFLKLLSHAINNAWTTTKNFGDDRRLLSRRLNTLFMELNQIICGLNDGETDTGAWCITDFQSHHMTDAGLAYAMARMLQDQTVGSFGDGPGHYRTLILGTGLVRSYDAYDGSPMIEQVTTGNVSYVDLTIPQYGLPIYDWIISMEVVEHIPADYEHVFLENVVRHARHGLIFSWGQPGQVGVGHVNGQSDEYVEAKMRSLCFDRDVHRSRILQNVTTLWWLQTNLFVYVRRKDCPVNEGDA